MSTFMVWMSSSQNWAQDFAESAKFLQPRYWTIRAWLNQWDPDKSKYKNINTT